MTTQPRIALDDLTSDALDQMYDRLDLLENGARERSALLEEARDALEAAGINEAHGGESWPRLVPAIEELAAERDRLATALEQLAAVPDRTTLPELHQRIVDTVTTAYPDLRPVADDFGHLVLAARDQHIEHLEQRITGLEGLVARVRQTVDAGPVGSCCAHLIRAALNPPTSTAATKEPT
ncbi:MULTISPECIES: hypothetical protein [unclassified Streptomyces]|uniref:hypothetical protein n=1 Tax=unclassified Streptomyces TaxID=2593676 RepID=UPI000BF1DB0D|nr:MULTISPECIES: hypothetical protein [unclassified Streptomyces]